jgi:hypothetical protein
VGLGEAPVVGEGLGAVGEGDAGAGAAGWIATGGNDGGNRSVKVGICGGAIGGIKMGSGGGGASSESDRGRTLLVGGFASPGALNKSDPAVGGNRGGRSTGGSVTISGRRLCSAGVSSTTSTGFLISASLAWVAASGRKGSRPSSKPCNPKEASAAIAEGLPLNPFKRAPRPDWEVIEESFLRDLGAIAAAQSRHKVGSDCLIRPICSDESITLNSITHQRIASQTEYFRRCPCKSSAQTAGFAVLVLTVPVLTVLVLTVPIRR